MSDYPGDWSRRREHVLDRDDHQCQNCKAAGGDDAPAELEVHHVVPIAAGGSHDLSNLITLCRRCHMAVHGEIRSIDHDPDDLDGTPEQEDTDLGGLPAVSDVEKGPARAVNPSPERHTPPRRRRAIKTAPIWRRFWWWLTGVPDDVGEGRGLF